MQIKKLIVTVTLLLLAFSVIAIPVLAEAHRSPPGQVITGGSFSCATGYSGTVVYTDPCAYYPQCFSWGGASNTYGPQAREFFTDEDSNIISLEGTVHLENMGLWTGPYGSTSYLEVGLGFLNSWYFTEDGYPNWKGPSCYIIFFGNDGSGYDVHIQTQPGERPGSVLTFPATTINGVYEPASFRYKMTVDFDAEEIYLWAKHSGTTDEHTYSFDDFGWYYGTTYPEDLAGGSVFAGMISDDPDDAGHASISAIMVTQ